MKIIGGSLDNDIHVAGILNFFALVQDLGYETYYLGPANSANEFIINIKKLNPDIVAVSYRLSLETAEKLLFQFKKAIKKSGLIGRKYIFGGTPSTAKIAEKIGIFYECFDTA
jgi:methanogenic corrinoid protein MtbC1